MVVWLQLSTSPVGKCGDLAVTDRRLTMHQAASSITAFGHRMSKSGGIGNHGADGPENAMTPE